MDVGKYIARLRAGAAEHASGALKRGPGAPSDPGYTLGWLCGYQAGMTHAEEVLNEMLNEEAEKDREEAA